MAASVYPLLSSSPSSIRDLQQWVTQISKTCENHLLVDTNLPVCIFQLPETLSSEKPESYIPQHIGLGPIHHFRTELYGKQEQLKITTAKTVLKPYKITSEFQKTVVEILRKFVPQARCCYDLYFDIDDHALSWVFAMDGLFLLHALSEVSEGGSLESFADVMMMENQIPHMVLVELRNALEVHLSGDSACSSLLNLLVKVCEARSPLKLTTPVTQLDLDVNSCLHLLDCMYLLIVNHNVAAKNQFLRANLLLDVRLEDVENAVQMAGELFPGAIACLQPVMLIFKLPWDKIKSLVKKILGEKPRVLEIDIPSASKLSNIGKIEFCSTPGGIRDIEFDDEKHTLCLPVLSLKSDSEVILRNLVAYEGLMFKKGEFPNLDLTEYVDLICGIIDGIKDVNILREKGVIEGDLGDDEIVKLFNGIRRSRVKTDEIKKSDLRKTIEKINKHYGSMPMVKAYDFVKKVFLASWKIFAIVFAVVNLVLLILVGVCQVYKCSSHSSGLGYVRLLFHYATKGNQLVDF